MHVAIEIELSSDFFYFYQLMGVGKGGGLRPQCYIRGWVAKLGDGWLSLGMGS
jgi:hypothetical protein